MADCISTLIDQCAIDLELFNQPVASVEFEAHVIIHWHHPVRFIPIPAMYRPEQHFSHNLQVR